MGFFDDDEFEALLEESNKFKPQELTEGNVQAIFNRCLATKEDATDDITASILFQQDLGYDEDSKPVFFNKTKVEQNKKNILYLLGQLRTSHGDKFRLASDNAIYRYDDVKWTGDTVKLMELYHLGEATRGIYPFVKQSNTARINDTSVVPTLSPKDPAFPAWWEAHKAEWED